MRGGGAPRQGGIQGIERQKKTLVIGEQDPGGVVAEVAPPSPGEVWHHLDTGRDTHRKLVGEQVIAQRARLGAEKALAH